jgi:hypothetical protein
MSTTIPQTKTTEKFQKTMGGSIKSLFSPGSRTYFVLEHKTNTAKHRPGESANFMSDYVEIGRGNNYAVNFGDDCKTVSRPHAAIVRKESNWLITPISKTNATLVNGQSINRDTLLKNGDEIQLSVGGPKLSFLIPANPKVSGLNFTVRMKAAMNEAIRPYRKTIFVISAIFILAIAGLSYYFMGKVNKSEKIIGEILSRRPQRDTLITHDTVRFQVPTPRINANGSGNTNSTQPISKLYSNIYYIESYKIEVNDDGKDYVFNYGISGTGFLMDNGQFVTARHVVEPWLFPSSKEDTTALAVNVLATKGATVKFFFTAYSPDGDKINMTSSDFVFDQSKDEEQLVDIFDTKVKITLPTSDGLDWASSTVNSKSGGLQFDKDLSSSLQASTQLYVLGYPWGLGVNSETDIKPLYSECKVSRDGLNKGIIDAGNIGIDHGNSGGPVFAKDNDGKYIVVGIVSAARSNQGFLVPISAVR